MTKDIAEENNIYTKDELLDIAKNIHSTLDKIRTNRRCDCGSFEYFTTSDDFPLFYREWKNENPS
jgi:hypothetical protein